MDLGVLQWGIYIAIVAISYYIFGIHKYRYFGLRGVKSIKPSVPFFGNMFKMLIGKEHFTEIMTKVYNAFPGEKYVGYHEIFSEIIMLKDIELIKQIGVKDFDHFIDHRNFLGDTQDSLFEKHLFSLQGQKWKDMRSTLSPAFTSSKMRAMFSLVIEGAEEMSNYFIKKSSGDQVVELEMKDCFSKYTNDVIASCAFGYKVNSFEDDKNDFYLMGKKVSNFSISRLIKFLGMRIAPKIMKLLNIKIFDKKLENFFRKLVRDTMNEREKYKIIRNDMIQLLMEAKKGSLKHETQDDQHAGFATVEESDIGKETKKTEWTEDDLIAQAFLFFVAGFDTTSTLLSFFAYEMIHYPDIQKRVQNEIDDVKATLNREPLTYNDLPKLKYLDMVISETLRMWPPAVATDRVCVKPYVLPPPNPSARTFTLYVKDCVWIPIYAIHHDPEHFPDPERFDPERFSDENKASIKPYTFVPFGVGPRNCIGSRFALMEAKAVVFYLLANFDFVPISKSKIPIEISKNSLPLKAKDGCWVGLKPRNK